MKGWVDLVVCPVCGHGLTEQEASLNCKNCNVDYAIVDGIPMLMRSGTRDTILDLKTYAEFTSVAPQAVENTYHQFRHAVGAANKALEGTLLEIGTGTGLLTQAMIRHAHFQRIVTTDVSLAFMRHTRDRLKQDLSPNHYFMACDGNALPLRKGIFDVVLGRSVLHHLLHYRQTLSQVHELLCPGGVAVFFEPVQSGKALIAFMFRIVLGVEDTTGALGLTQKEKDNLARALKGLMRPVTIEQSEEVLSKLEDKYIFDIDDLCSEARAMGFEALYVNLPSVDQTYFSYLSMHLRSFGVRPEIVAKVKWLKGAFGETIGAMARDKLSAPMGYFVFTKIPAA